MISITTAARNAVLFAIALMFATPLAAQEVDMHNPVGIAGIFNGNITTACSYDPLTHSARREVTDMVVPGSIGKYPLKLTRYYNSRGKYGGLGPGWRAEYWWSLSQRGSILTYPNGNVLDKSCQQPVGISDGWQTGPVCDGNGCNGDFRLADGGTVHFVNGAVTIDDPYGQTTTITNTSNTMKVTEPGGRYLLFTYNGPQSLLSRVEAHGLGNATVTDWVNYSYTLTSPGGNGASLYCLTGVAYSDGTSASYTYTQDNVQARYKVLPLLATANDVRYNGPMRQIAYDYQGYPTPHGAITAERYSAGGTLVSRITPGATLCASFNCQMETDFTETRGDGPSRTFHYTNLSYSTNPQEPGCPETGLNPPSQFLRSYTDFDSPGHKTWLGYDGNWYVNSVTDARGASEGDPNHTTTYTRGDPRNGGIGEILSIRHPAPDNSSIQYGYQDHRYLTSIIDERGNKTIHMRNPTTHQITRTDWKDANDNTIAFENFTYNSFGQVLTHRLKNGAYESFAYGGRGLLNNKWNPKQNAIPSGTDPHTHYTYYTSGPWTDRVQTVTLPANVSGYQATETYEYDRALDANGVTDPNGAPKAGRGLVTKITHGGDNTYQSFGYDAYGNKRWEENELRKRTSYTYDDYNRVLSVKDPIGQTTGRTTSYTYLPTNGNGTSPYLHTTNNADTATTPTGIVTTYDYDENFHKTSVRVGSSTTWFHYDPVGNQNYVTDPRGTGSGDLAYTTYSDYDERNRKWRVREPLSRVTEFHYDDHINVTRIIRPDQTTETKSYDAMNRVLSDTVPQTASVNVTTSFLYNPSGTIQQVTDPGGHQTTFDYDASDQKETMSYPGGIQSQSWTYDDARNLKSRTTVGGKVEQFTYDSRNRKDTMTCSIPNPLTWIEWADYGYDAASHLTLAKNGTGPWNQNVISTITRQYDDAGRLTLDQQNVNGLGIKNVYYPLHDADGKLTRMYVGGASPAYDYTFDYDDMGRFETIKPTGGSAVFQYHYDAASNEVQRDNLQNGVQQIYPRDSLNRMLYLNLSNGLSHEGYVYDAMNRLRSVTRQGNLTDSFTYYLNGELHTAFYDRTDRNVNYALSRAGNRTSVVDDGATTTYTPNAFNQYSNVTGSTIHNGNEHEIDQYKGPSDAQLVSYTYLTDRDLGSVNSGSDSYSLAYDAVGRCVKRDLNGVATYYIYDGERPIVEYNSSGTIIARNVYGKGVDEILMRTNPGINSGQPFYYAQDHEGSVTHLLNSSGAIIERYRYDAFGAPTFFNGGGTQILSTAYNNRFLFTGREYAATYRNTYIPACSFYEYRARAYNPTLGRFMSEDPKLFDAGDYNLFRYCHNDPIDFTDPMGLDAQAWIEAIVPGAYEYNQMVANFHAGNYGTAAGWAGTMLVSQYASIVSGTSSTRAQASFRAARIAASERQVTAVLGKFENKPNFQRVAEHLGVKSLNIPQHIYDKMTPAQQWTANQKMLDRAIARGGDFLFDKPIKDISSTSGGLRKELDYLSDKGFKLSPDGWRMTKSESSVLKAAGEADTHSRHIPMPEPR